MASYIRDAPAGQLLRWMTGNKVFKYPEEQSNFECPSSYRQDSIISMESAMSVEQSPEEEEKDTANDQKEGIVEDERRGIPPMDRSLETAPDLNKVATVPIDQDDENHGVTKPEASHLEGIHSSSHRYPSDGRFFRPSLTLSSTSPSRIEAQTTQADLDQALSEAFSKPQPSRPIAPRRTGDGTVLVDWYTTDDPDNPQNWTNGKKLFVTFLICMYTTAVYAGSSMYVSGEQQIMEQFGVNSELASMGLSIYVIAYGLGPLLWAPLSEIPAIGRNPPYITTFVVFLAMTIPTATVNNFPGLIVCRFLLGFFGSPCLATGGATLQDMWNARLVPYVLCLWSLAATCGPALAPTISGFADAAESWRWSGWIILWWAAPVFIGFFFFLPETNAATLLLQRAKRLRAITGQTNLRSQSELDQAEISVPKLLWQNLYRPLQMMVMDPAVGFTAVYTALVYGIYYSFFECFPIVYNEGYGMNQGESGLVYLTITIGVILSILSLWAFQYFIVDPHIRTHGYGPPERSLVPSLFATFLCPIGLFVFAWTSNSQHYAWIVPTIGIFIFSVGIFVVMQCIFTYLPLTYPQYAASLFAGNDFTRSMLAAGAIHFATPLFGNLGVGRGVSLLGGLTAGCSIGMYALYFYGGKLRSRSKFSAQ